VSQWSLDDRTGTARTIRRCLRSAIATATLVGLPAAAHACDLPHESRHVAQRATDGQTLELDDGSSVVLLGMLPPVSIEAQISAPPSAGAAASQTALSALVTGKALDLAYSGRRVDRYGRKLAHAFVATDDGGVWVQGAMVSRGMARAAALPGADACIEELLAAERDARTSGTGHWATGVFQSLDARDTGAIAAYRDTFQMIEGRVAGVRRDRGRVYITFGDGGRGDFSVIVTAAGRRRVGTGERSTTDLADLMGQRIRVRGWIEVKRGPVITLANDRQIERLEEPEAAGGGPLFQGQPIPAATPAK
jgi:micrococcal nuclease